MGYNYWREHNFGDVLLEVARFKNTATPAGTGVLAPHPAHLRPEPSTFAALQPTTHAHGSKAGGIGECKSQLQKGKRLGSPGWGAVPTANSHGGVRCT